MQRMLFRLFAGILSVLLCLLSITGCSTEAPDPTLMMKTFCERYRTLPAGNVYFLGVEAYEEGYISPTLINALYKSGEKEPPVSSQTAGALFLGADLFTPEEAGIFLCRTGDEAEAVAAMCLARLSRLRQSFPAADTLKGASVHRHGHTVFYTVLPDNDLAIKMIRELF